MRVPLTERRVLGVESALEKKVGKRLKQIFSINAEIFAGIARIFYPLHGAALKAGSRKHLSLIVLAAVAPRRRSTFFTASGRLPFLFLGRKTLFFRTADPPVRIQTLENKFRSRGTHGIWFVRAYIQG